MHDPRIDQLARQLVRYSTGLKRGEKVLIDLYDVPEAVGIALVREARARRGRFPWSCPELADDRSCASL